MNQKVAPTHRCKVCGALWREWHESESTDDSWWTLVSNSCGSCCDNEPMGDHLESLGDWAERVRGVGGPGLHPSDMLTLYREILKHDPKPLPVRLLNLLWIRFSDDQGEDCVAADRKSIRRFMKWLETGLPLDAEEEQFPPPECSNHVPRAVEPGLRRPGRPEVNPLEVSKLLLLVAIFILAAVGVLA